MSSNPRLTALLAALAIAALAVFAAGCGDSDDDGTTAAVVVAAKRSRSAPTSPIPRSRNSAKPRANSKASTSSWSKR